MASGEGGQLLQYAAFSSALDAGFWHQLTKLKLDVFQLDDNPQPISGYYFNGNAQGLPCQLNLDYNAFSQDDNTPPRHIPYRGFIKNTNTIDAFRDLDKRKLLSDVAVEMWDDLVSGRAVDNPSLLSKFLLITFADLKKYHYYYWFAFPALASPDRVEVLKTTPVTQRFTPQQITQLMSGYDEKCVSSQCAYFLVVESNSRMIVGHLNEFNALSQLGKVSVCFCDPCTLESHPGWPLRNLLALAAYHWSDQLGGQAEVICLRDRYKEGHRSFDHSLVLNVTLPSTRDTTECPKAVGWEKNERQKMGPRMVNLSASMDPARLAESAVDLNLKLMRWRLIPRLDLEKISSTRCLLLGAGTLGCNVARALLGWGMRTITFVDNGQISYSNPVRQSLFTFEDSQQGGRNKAECAAEALRKIFPGVKSEGHVFSIPMPGHPVSDAMAEKTKEDVSRLEQLIDEHDAVFLLLDTRESRWLPTVLGAAKGKIVMNAALGFDTFLVLRHGMRNLHVAMETDSEVNLSVSSAHIPGSNLGCYFCNDVVAPGNSTQDRTLDQQCTVSRPGMSMLTSALVVELLVSILTHPLGGHAAADTNNTDDSAPGDSGSPLGLVPHQIRGFLSRFHHMMPASQAFDRCTACSSKVLEAYAQDGIEFLLRAFNEGQYLEDLTGLSQLHADTNLEEVWDFSDCEEI